MPKVLIVNDSRVVLAMHGQTLRSAGMMCSSAESAGLALGLLAEEHFDLILADINMSHMDGYEFSRRVRVSGENKDTPIIMLATDREASEASRGMDARFNVLVVEPILREHLVQYAQMLLRDGLV